MLILNLYKVSTGTYMRYYIKNNLIKLIKSESDYQNALTEIEKLMDAEEGSEECEKLKALVELVENYELKNFPIE